MKKELVSLLKGGSAHLPFSKLIDNISPENRNRLADSDGMLHTIWEELEHIRRAQEDIIRYTFDESWESPVFPDGYWPEKNKFSEQAWSETIDGFISDLDDIIKFIQNTDIDLTTEIPHGEGRTYLRQILLIADHNAYHFGKIVDLRKRLGDWR